MRKYLIALIVILSVFHIASAEDWQLITDMRNVRDIECQDGILWCATEGGLAALNPQSGKFTSLTMLDGLSGVGINRVRTDGSHGLWLTFDNRNIQRFEPGRGVTHTISRLAQESGINSLKDIYVDGSRERIYVATNRGIARLDYVAAYDRWVWLEEYRRFNQLSDPDVRKVIVAGGYLWAATSAGVVRGDLSLETLVNPSNWRLFTTGEGIPGNNVSSIAALGDDIIISTTSGLGIWNGTNWQLLSNRTDISRLYVINDSLRALGRDGVYTWDGSSWSSMGFARQWLTSVAYCNTDGWFLGAQRNWFSGGGVVTPVDTGWVNYRPSGPTSNLILSMAFSLEGDLLMVGGRGGAEYGLSRWDGHHWRIWTAPEENTNFYANQPRSVTTDRRGGVWVGSFMGGVAWYGDDDSVRYYNYSSSTGSRLVGYGESVSEINAVLTPSVACDASGNIWIVNRGAYNGNVLVCVPSGFIDDPQPEKEWVYFHRSLFNNYPHFDLVAIDGRGRKWIGSTDPSAIADRGVYVLDDRGTLDDPSDDIIRGPIPGLNSPQVMSIAWDPTGYIWVGSIDGAYYINATTTDLSIARFTSIYWLRDLQINAIAIDPAGNKWFGSDFGVTILAPDMFTILRRISVDPPDKLPNARIHSIAVDSRSGWVYIGTADGTAALRTGYRDFGSQIGAVEVEPNPYNPNSGLLIFNGSSLAGNAGATILTPDGRRVRALSHFEASLGWDGRDDTGHIVADGVYIVLTHNSAGQTGKTKIAVIRR